MFWADSGEDGILEFEQGKDVIDVSGTGLTAADFATHVDVGLVTFDQVGPGPDRVSVETSLGIQAALTPADFIFAS